jgi:multidrug resistance efflux pump
MDETSRAILTVSGVLFGFFFAAFWWILKRESRSTGRATFQARDRGRALGNESK